MKWRLPELQLFVSYVVSVLAELTFGHCQKSKKNFTCKFSGFSIPGRRTLGYRHPQQLDRKIWNDFFSDIGIKNAVNRKGGEMKQRLAWNSDEQRVSWTTEWSMRLPVWLATVSRQTLFHPISFPLHSKVSILTYSVWCHREIPRRPSEQSSSHPQKSVFLVCI